MLICVFLGSAFQNQGSPENVAWVLTVDAVEGLDLFHMLRRMVFLQLPSSVLLCNWQALDSNTYPS